MELKYLIETILKYEEEIRDKHKELEDALEAFEAKKAETNQGGEVTKNISWQCFSEIFGAYVRTHQIKEDLELLLKSSREQKEKLYTLMVKLHNASFKYPENGVDENKGYYLIEKVLDEHIKDFNITLHKPGTA